jgi:hypothetical protein
MKWLVLISLCVITGLAACLSSGAEVHHVKDLDEDMLDLKIYHQNLGGSLADKNKDEAAWLAHDMDSVLQLMGKMFPSHRKLQESFRKNYEKRLQPSMNMIIFSIEKDDWPTAIKAYKTLTSKCNGCHDDHEIDKEVRDWSQ